MFYFQNFNGFEPDTICLSKVFGGGKSSISAVVVNENVYNKAYGKLNDTFLHTTTFNGFAEESITALEALNIFSEEKFKNQVKKLSETLKIKLNNLKLKHEDKIEKIKGNGILNGIVFKSYLSNLGNLVEKFPLSIISNKSFFLKKLTATAVSSELYQKHNILTQINDSSNSNHLSVSPALIMDQNNIDYFFDSLDEVLLSGVNIKSFEIILDFVKSKI